jgi:hypothetical protein
MMRFFEVLLFVNAILLWQMDIVYSQSSSIVTDELQILYDLYDSTDGDNWYFNTNWKSDLPLENWYGVDIYDNGQVHLINLDSNNLHGMIA